MTSDKDVEVEDYKRDRERRMRWQKQIQIRKSKIQTHSIYNNIKLEKAENAHVLEAAMSKCCVFA